MSGRKDNLFKSVPIPNVKRNHFDLSHERKTSMKFGVLYPVLCTEVLPGETWSNQMTAMVRFAPMLFPVMHRCDVIVHFFNVPNRIICGPWQEFITGGDDGLSAPILPYFTPSSINAIGVGSEAVMRKGTLLNRLGFPPLMGAEPAVYDGQTMSLLPLRAYHQIYNDYYRDPTIDDEVDLDIEGEGNRTAVSYSAGIFDLKRKGWEKDYFTACLPFAQRGAQVLMPLSGNADVTYLDASLVKRFDGSMPPTGDIQNVAGTLQDVDEISSRIENIDEVVFENSTITINDLRTALAVQRWLENNARGGPRYIEQLESHFSVRVPDYRLQRAEYLGGGRQPVVISQVLATAKSEDTPLGEMAGHGISVGKSNRFSYQCKEHGFIIGIMTIMPRTGYFQGLSRMWTRFSKFSYGWPELANLGEQEIFSREIFYSFDSADTAGNNSTFGYLPRFAEYKYHPDVIDSDFVDTLDEWHLARIFTERPSLDFAFLAMIEDGPLSGEDTFRRIFAVQDGTDYLWCQLFHKLHAKRPLPYFGVPKII